MSNQHSKTLASNPIPVGDVAQRPFAQSGGVRMRALHASERVLLFVGLICILAYFGARLYASAMYRAGPPVSFP